MNEINWNQFMLKNANPQEAFETICRNLFLREYKVSSHEFSANYNQTGLEIEPIFFEDKYYGFQCKYSTSGNSTKYYIYHQERLVKSFNMVWVDGYRALIPMPDYTDKHIDRDAYRLACLVNSNVETLNHYIISSGLTVD